MRQHTNAFDLLRLLGAGLVLWSHQYALLGLSAAMIVLLATFSALFVEQPAQARQQDVRHWIRKTIIGRVRQKAFKGA